MYAEEIPVISGFHLFTSSRHSDTRDLSPKQFEEIFSRTFVIIGYYKSTEPDQSHTVLTSNSFIDFSALWIRPQNPTTDLFQIQPGKYPNYN